MELIQHRWVSPSDLNAHGNLFGGQILSWVDEDSSMCAHNFIANSDNHDQKLTTVSFDYFAFKKPAFLGDRLIFKYNIIGLGKSSVSVKAIVSNYVTGELIAYGFANLCCIDTNGKPISHNFASFTSKIVDFFKEKRLELSKLLDNSLGDW